MALWPIFCVARSSRTDLSMLVARALKIGQIAVGGMPPTLLMSNHRGDGYTFYQLYKGKDSRTAFVDQDPYRPPGNPYKLTLFHVCQFANYLAELFAALFGIVGLLCRLKSTCCQRTT